MKFNAQKLEVYKKLIETTELQEGYQEFIKLFRYLRIELEKDLYDFSFSGSIVENRMDFAYFQLLSDELKEKGLKAQIVFVHKEYQFEVWISGFNRKIQCNYYNYLKDQNIKYIVNSNPNRVDYIIKSPLPKDIDISNGVELIEQLKSEVNGIVTFAKNITI